jgi:aminoglycoside phosphotransferase (APT) family kinase protein
MPASAPRVIESPVITDPAIATLPAVLDARALAAQLGEFLPTGEAGLEAVQIQVLRHHAGKRCVIEVTVRSTEGSLSLIGKVYANDRSHVYRLMEELRRAGFGPHERFSIPQPMAYLQPLQLMWQEKVEGRPATESFLSDEERDRTDAAERCAGWLARFHAMALQLGQRFDPSSHLLAMERWLLRLASVGEPLAERARTLFERLQAAASALPTAGLCTIHGDYSHHQVILTPERTVTVDWDRYRLADPAQDVARFTVGLQRLALRSRGSLRSLDGPANVFLEAYHDAAPSVLAARLPFHRAAICLEHAKHDVHKQADGWPEKAAATLDEGVRVLAEGF